MLLAAERIYCAEGCKPPQPVSPAKLSPVYPEILSKFALKSAHSIDCRLKRRRAGRCEQKDYGKKLVHHCCWTISGALPLSNRLFSPLMTPHFASQLGVRTQGWEGLRC
jgi:hypothetical protein